MSRYHIPNDKYQLIAQNESGAIDVFYGKSLREVLEDFDFLYTRSGWKIRVLTSGLLYKEIKKTFR